MYAATQPEISEHAKTPCISDAPSHHSAHKGRLLPKEATDVDIEWNELSDAPSEATTEATTGEHSLKGSCAHTKTWSQPSSEDVGKTSVQHRSLVWRAASPPEADEAARADARASAVEASPAAPHVAHSLATCISQIEGVLQAVVEAAGAGAPVPVVSNMLAYVLHTTRHWPVRFRCCAAAQCSASHRNIFGPWIEDVLVVSPSESIQCLVDLDFRTKFMIPDAGPYSAVFNDIPRVYVGSWPQLTADLQKWMAPLEWIFAQKGLTLPPWRRRSTLLQMYTACVDCDPTSSYVCLRDIDRQLAQRSGGAGLGGASECPRVLEDSHLGHLRALLGRLEAAGATPLHRAASCAMGDMSEGCFEKEECPVPMPTDTRSGLSILMDRAAETRVQQHFDTLPKEQPGARESTRGWVSRVMPLWR